MRGVALSHAQSHSPRLIDYQNRAHDKFASCTAVCNQFCTDMTRVCLCMQWKQGSFWVAASAPSTDPDSPSSGNMQMGQSPSGKLAAFTNSCACEK